MTDCRDIVGTEIEVGDIIVYFATICGSTVGSIRVVCELGTTTRGRDRKNTSYIKACPIDTKLKYSPGKITNLHNCVVVKKHTHSDDKIIEALAELEHQQWCDWSQSIVATEDISQDRLSRWAHLWRPYSELSDTEKQSDRHYANKVYAVIKKFNWGQ